MDSVTLAKLQEKIKKNEVVTEERPWYHHSKVRRYRYGGPLRVGLDIFVPLYWFRPLGNYKPVVTMSSCVYLGGYRYYDNPQDVTRQTFFLYDWEETSQPFDYAMVLSDGELSNHFWENDYGNFDKSRFGGKKFHGVVLNVKDDEITLACDDFVYEFPLSYFDHPVLPLQCVSFTIENFNQAVKGGDFAIRDMTIWDVAHEQLTQMPFLNNTAFNFAIAARNLLKNKANLKKIANVKKRNRMNRKRKKDDDDDESESKDDKDETMKDENKNENDQETETKGKESDLKAEIKGKECDPKAETKGKESDTKGNESDLKSLTKGKESEQKSVTKGRDGDQKSGTKGKESDQKTGTKKDNENGQVTETKDNGQKIETKEKESDQKSRIKEEEKETDNSKHIDEEEEITEQEKAIMMDVTKQLLAKLNIVVINDTDTPDVKEDDSATEKVPETSKEAIVKEAAISATDTDPEAPKDKKKPPKPRRPRKPREKKEPGKNKEDAPASKDSSSSPKKVPVREEPLSIKDLTEKTKSEGTEENNNNSNSSDKNRTDESVDGSPKKKQQRRRPRRRRNPKEDNDQKTYVVEEGNQGENNPSQD